MDRLYDVLRKRFGWDREEVDQNLLVAGIVLVVIVLLGIFGYSMPGARPFALWLVKLIVYIFEGVFLVFGLSFVGHFVFRSFIEFLDEKRASSIDLSPWVHWMLNIVLSIFFGWLWTYIVSDVVSIPGYLQSLFVSWNWYIDGMVMGLGSWWVVGSLAFFFGYFWRGIKEEFLMF